MSDGSPGPAPHQPKFNGDYYPRMLAGTPIIATGSVLYRRRLFDEIGGFDPAISPAADYDLYYRVTRDYDVHCHGALVAAYRRHGGNMTSNFATMLRTNMISIRRQRRYVLRHPRYWSAYRRGVRYWQDHVGGLVAQQVQRDFLQGRLVSALRGVGTLIVWSPRSLGPMVRAGRWLLAPTEWKPEVA